MHTTWDTRKIIEKKRKRLNEKDLNSSEILKESKDLDKWIIEYYKKKSREAYNI